MSAEHILSVAVDGRGWVDWKLTCSHEHGKYPTVDLDDWDEATGTHPVLSEDCWAKEYFDEVSLAESAAGEWPDDLRIPCAVRPLWEDGLALFYEGPVDS